MGNGQNQARKNVIWNMIGSFIFALASIVLFAAATRATGEYWGGIFSIAFTTGQILLTIGYYEVRPFQVTDMKYQYSFQEYFSLRCMTSIAMALFGFVYVWITRPDADKGLVIILMCFYKLMDGVADVFEGEFQRQGRLDLAGKSLAYRTALSGAVFIIAAFVTKSVVAASIAAVIAAVIGVIIFDIVLIPEFEPLKFSKAWGKIGRLLRDCFLLFIGNFLYLYICNAAKYAVDAHMSAEAVTYYTDIFLPTSTINLLSGFVFKPLLTTMGDAFTKKQWQQFRQLITKLMIGILGLTVICCLGGYLLGVPVLSWFFGQDLKPYKMSLVILLLGGGCNAAVMFLYYVLTTMRKQAYILGCYIAAFVIAIFFAPYMVKQYAIVGGAISYTVVMGFLALLFLLCSMWQYSKEKRKDQMKLEENL